MSDRPASSAVALAVVTLCVVTLGPVAALRGDDVTEQINERIQNLFEESKDSVVRIEATDLHGQLSGTGFFADPSGTVYTLAAVVENAEDIVVKHGSRSMPARLLTSDPRSGVALLKVDERTPFIPLGDSDDLEVADAVLSLGYPQDRDLAPNFGMVAGFDISHLGLFFATTHVRANMPVQRGQGGSPVLNMKGEVIGMVVSSFDSGASCYFIPIKAIEKLRRDYVRFGEARPGWVGVRVEEALRSVEGSRAKIRALDPSTPAAKSGLESGDVLIELNGRKITSVEDIIDPAFFLTAGELIEMKVVRDGEILTFESEPQLHPVIAEKQRKRREPFVGNLPSLIPHDSEAGSPTATPIP